jgi:hypothetical protein
MIPRPDGETGKHMRLKISRHKACGFDSRSGHQNLGVKMDDKDILKAWNAQIAEEVQQNKDDALLRRFVLECCFFVCVLVIILLVISSWGV